MALPFLPSRIQFILNDELAIFAEKLAVHTHLATAAQIADHVPVQRRLIHAACLWNARAQGEMDGATHFLVEKGVFDAAINVFVIAKGKFAQAARAFIQRQHFIQKCLTMRGARLDHHTIFKLLSPYSSDCTFSALTIATL